MFKTDYIVVIRHTINLHVHMLHGIYSKLALTVSFILPRNIYHHHNRFYSLLQALTARTMLFHWLRSCASFLHPWIPRIKFLSISQVCRVIEVKADREWFPLNRVQQ
jgi:hypothetical protein